MAQKFLEKLQYRCMIEYLRTNLPTAAPGRSDDQRDAISEPDGTLTRLPLRFPLQILLHRYPLHPDIDAFGYQAGAGLVRMRRRKGRDVIEVSVIFVISQY